MALLLLGKWHGDLAAVMTVDSVDVVVTLSLKVTSLPEAATATTSDIDDMTLSIPSSFVLNLINSQSFTQLSTSFFGSPCTGS